jgi:group I intron endonuclease
MPAGIYKITNLVNGKIYIGSSVDVMSRWANHRSTLRRGKHKNPHLQSAWLKYGENNFRFDVVKYLLLKEGWSDKEKNEEILRIEQTYLDESGCLDRDLGYNIRPRSDRKFHSEETKKKMRKPKPEGFGDARRGEKNSFYGREHSEEALRVMSEKKTGKNNPNYGKSLSDGHRAKIAQAHKKLSDEQESEICERFKAGETKASLSREFGVSWGTVRNVIKRGGPCSL